MATIFHNVDDWIFAQGLEYVDTTWIREAWETAARTTRAQAMVQQKILQGELDMCNKKNIALEERLKLAEENIGYLEEVVREEMK
jgi:hypothetical protein